MMPFLHLYATLMTVLCIVCAVGWYLSHKLVKAIAACPASDWPGVRRLLAEQFGDHE